MKKCLIALLSGCIFCSCNAQVNPDPTKRPDKESDEISVATLIPNLQPEDPYFIVTKDTISTNGPQNITRNILEDRDGNIWLASWEGIIRYDGTQFTNYTLKESLRQFHVFSILEDRQGYIWFGTIRGGLYRYNPSADQTSGHYDATKAGTEPFTLFTTADGLANNMVLCMMQDKDGYIWFGTDDGVSRYDPASNPTQSNPVFTNFTSDHGLCGNSVNSIVQDAKGQIWFGTRGGENGDACYYDGKSFTIVTNAIGLRFSNVRMIVEDKQGVIWIGGQDGLYRYDSSAAMGTIGRFMTTITKDFIGYIFEDKAGNLWLSQSDANEMSLYRYDGKTFSKVASRGQVFGITEDKHGNIWFGSIQGVTRYDGTSFEDFSD
jgi:ligand-binding sensor domain-containing protein